MIRISLLSGGFHHFVVLDIICKVGTVKFVDDQGCSEVFFSILLQNRDQQSTPPTDLGRKLIAHSVRRAPEGRARLTDAFLVSVTKELCDDGPRFARLGIAR